MNIFFLDWDPVVAAQMQCDAHVVKMVIESAQMLSTAHRMLDGTEYFDLSNNGRRVRRWRLDDEREHVLYKAVHMNHPCTVWTRANTSNYHWHYRHFVALCDEFSHRYGKTHATDNQLRGPLMSMPENIPYSSVITSPALAMEEMCKTERNTVDCYRRFYQTKQQRFNMRWTKRHVPNWFHFYDETYIL